MIVTTIRLQTTPDNRKEILQTFRSLTDPIRCRSGCKSCRVYRELGNDETVILIQEWDSRNHWDEHLRSNEFAVMIGVMSLLQKPETVEFQVLDQVEGSHSVDAIRARNFKGTR